MKPSFRVYLTLLLVLLLSVNFSTLGQDINIKIGFRDTLKSEVLKESRTILIHLPDDYSPEKSYPVLYRLDGDPELLMETISTTNRLTYGDEITPEMIIIAIENTNRPRDMWPTNTMYYPETEKAGAKEFLKFIDNELIPYVESKYRTNDRILCGQSLSGVFTMYAFLTRPKLFNSYIVCSGAFPGCNEYFKDLYTKSFQRLDQFNGLKIFITNGLQDPLDPDGSFEEQVNEFSNTIKNQLGNRVRHQYVTYENEGHVPFHSLYDGLRFVFLSE